MYRIDVYKDNKKVASHWYLSKGEAANARNAILGIRKKKYTYIPGENRKSITRELGGWTVSKVVEDRKY